MPNYLGFFLERLVLFAPSVLSLLGVLLFLQFVRAWRLAIWQDRFLGIIDEDRKGEAPLRVILSLAATNALPLPILGRCWLSWMDRNYGAQEILTDDQKRQHVGEILSFAEYNTEVSWWGTVNVLLLIPLREELLFRTILVLLFPSFTIWGLAFIILVGGSFSALHWKGQVGLVSEDLRAWIEERDSRVTKPDRIRAASFSFVLGLVCGVAAVYFQNLWVAVAIHISWNYLVPRLMLMVMYWLRRRELITDRRLWKL